MFISFSQPLACSSVASVSQTLMDFNPKLARILSKIKDTTDASKQRRILFAGGTDEYTARTENLTLRQRLFGERKVLPCHYCAANVTLRGSSLDHKRPRSKGGRTTGGNCVIACKPCNARKRDMNYLAFIKLLEEEKRI